MYETLNWALQGSLAWFIEGNILVYFPSLPIIVIAEVLENVSIEGSA